METLRDLIFGKIYSTGINEFVMMIPVRLCRQLSDVESLWRIKTEKQLFLESKTSPLPPHNSHVIMSFQTRRPYLLTTLHFLLSALHILFKLFNQQICMKIP